MKTSCRVLFSLAVVGVFPHCARGDAIYVAEEQRLQITSVLPNGQTQFYAGGVGLIYGLAADSQGNIYAAGTGEDIIRKVSPSGGVTVYASSLLLGSPMGMAFDTAGNLYTTGYGWGGTVNRISPNGTVTRVETGIVGNDVAFDHAGNLYIAGGGSVTRITPSGDIQTFATGFQDAWGLAFDSSGNLFVSDYIGDTISKITPAGVKTVFATGLDLPTGLAFDSSGTLYVCNVTVHGPLGNVCTVSPTGQVSLFATGFDLPTAIVIVPEPSIFGLLFALGVGVFCRGGRTR